MSTGSAQSAGPFHKWFPMGFLLAFAACLRDGYFFSNYQVRFLNIVAFAGLVVVIYVVGGILDAMFFQKRVNLTRPSPTPDRLEQLTSAVSSTPYDAAFPHNANTPGVDEASHGSPSDGR